MDDLWKKQGKDLKMTVYNVVPTEYNKVKDVVSLIICSGYDRVCAGCNHRVQAPGGRGQQEGQW